MHGFFSKEMFRLPFPILYRLERQAELGEVALGRKRTQAADTIPPSEPKPW